MKKLDLGTIPLESGSNYPTPFDTPCLGQAWRRLGRAAGLTAFGVNLSRIPPGGGPASGTGTAMRTSSSW